MSKYEVKKGTTSELIEVFISDSSAVDGSGLTGVEFGDITGYYYRSGAGAVVEFAALKTMTLGTWVTEGFIEIDATNMPGYYQLGLPNTALVSGTNKVNIMLKGAADMAPLPIEISLKDNNEKDIYDIVNDGTSGNAQLMRTSDKGGRTVTTNSDKTGYSLAVTPPTAIQNRQEMDSNSTQLAVIIERTSNLPDDPADASVVAAGQVAIIAEVDENEVKIDVMQLDVNFLKGALGFNSVLDDFTYNGHKATAGTRYSYNSRTNALANGKTAATGLMFKQTLDATLDGNNDTDKLTQTDEVVT